MFVSGAGLEVFIDHLFENAGENFAVVPVWFCAELLTFGGERGDYHGDTADPHTWFNRSNVVVRLKNTERALISLDTENAGEYEAAAATYQIELAALNAWIEDQVAGVPAADRELVTDHGGFSYCALRDGFDQIGAVFAGYSTLAAPSARELAELQGAIEEHDVKAVFVGLMINPDLAERVAEDTGTQLDFLYAGSLSKPEGPAGDYISFMSYNVNAIVEALR